MIFMEHPSFSQAKLPIRLGESKRIRHLANGDAW